MLDDLRNALNDKKVIIGSKQSVKHLKLKNVKLVMLASNCPDNIKKDIDYYSKLTGIKVEIFNGTGKQLGVFCGKPFSIAVIAIK